MVTRPLSWIAWGAARRLRLLALGALVGETRAKIETAPVDRAAFTRTLREIDRLPTTK